jgi:alcohol dehydrogenase (NADP+)
VVKIRVRTPVEKITTSFMRHWGVTKGKKVGVVVVLGGLGHMAVKFAHAPGAHVVEVFATSSNKKEDELRQRRRGDSFTKC